MILKNDIVLAFDYVHRTSNLFYVIQQIFTNMKQKIDFNYEAPLVEIIEVEVEQGFATSNGTDPLNPGGPY